MDLWWWIGNKNEEEERSEKVWEMFCFDYGMKLVKMWKMFLTLFDLFWKFLEDVLFLLLVFDLNKFGREMIKDKKWLKLDFHEYFCCLMAKSSADLFFPFQLNRKTKVSFSFPFLYCQKRNFFRFVCFSKNMKRKIHLQMLFSSQTQREISLN